MKREQQNIAERVVVDSKKPKLAFSVQAELAKNAKALVAPGKGILVADESTGTIGKRFAAIQLPNTSSTRQAYLELLLTTPNLSSYLSGCILPSEPLPQSTSSHLLSHNILPGLRLDLGLAPLPGTPGEHSSQGLTDLDARCRASYAQGARFAQWRAVYELDLGKGKPSSLLVATQAQDLARFASVCQQHGLVPIVQPEVLMAGSDDVRTAARVCEHVWAAVVYQLQASGVLLEGCLLKANMVLAGQQAAAASAPEEVAHFTLQALMRTVPPSMAGIVFLSGGQSEEEASVNLSAISRLARERSAPWPLSFSFGRALQDSAMKVWKGQPENVEKAQSVFIERCKANSEAKQKPFHALPLAHRLTSVL